jgi:hypothetical protein
MVVPWDVEFDIPQVSFTSFLSFVSQQPAKGRFTRAISNVFETSTDGRFTMHSLEHLLVKTFLVFWYVSSSAGYKLYY